MHSLHHILVNIPEALGIDTDEPIVKSSRLANVVRRYAEEKTEDFYLKVFDWRETDTAGRWADIYPNNVGFASDNIEDFIKEIEECRKYQKEEIDNSFNILKGEKELFDFEKTIKTVWDCKTNGNENDIGSVFMTAYYIRCIAEILEGEYTFSSYFYNTKDYSSIISDELLNKIRENPKDWAIVRFDIHN